MHRSGFGLLRRSLGEEIVESGFGIAGSGDVGMYSSSSVGLLRELDNVLNRTYASEERARMLRRGRWKRVVRTADETRESGGAKMGLYVRILQAFRKYRDVDRWGT